MHEDTGHVAMNVINTTNDLDLAFFEFWKMSPPAHPVRRQ
jgi:hypothetical protein